jgi:hypothetical protein
VHGYATVLRQRICEFDGVQLDVGIAMRQPLYHGGDCLLGTSIAAADFVADIEDIFPVLGGQVLVGCFRYGSVVSFLWARVGSLGCGTETTYQHNRQMRFAALET